LPQQHWSKFYAMPSMPPLIVKIQYLAKFEVQMSRHAVCTARSATPPAAGNLTLSIVREAPSARAACYQIETRSEGARYI